MINYSLKSQVLNNGCVSDYNKLHKYYYLLRVFQDTGDLGALAKAERIDDHIDIDNFYNRYTSSEIAEASKVLNAHFQRTRHLKDKITAYLGLSFMFGRAVFLTLTFNDKTLSKTSAITRRRYVTRFLKEHSSNYVANVDYGKKHEREHYHALILCDSIDYTKWHEFGAVKGEKVRINDNESPVKMAKYISKLTNHAIKETAKGNRMIYSRNGIKVES